MLMSSHLSHTTNTLFQERHSHRHTDCAMRPMMSCPHKVPAKPLATGLLGCLHPAAADMGADFQKRPEKHLPSAMLPILVPRCGSIRHLQRHAAHQSYQGVCLTELHRFQLARFAEGLVEQLQLKPVGPALDRHFAIP